MIYHQRYAIRAEAKAAIKEYIEIFYNRQRRHSRLGYISPASFVKKVNKAASVLYGQYTSGKGSMEISKR